MNDDHFKYLVSGYFGIKSVEEYSSRLFILKDVEDYIKNYLKTSRKEDVNYQEMAINIEKYESLVEKLQDSLLVLKEIDGPMELVIIIKTKIKELRYSNKI